MCAVELIVRGRLGRRWNPLELGSGAGHGIERRVRRQVGEHVGLHGSRRLEAIRIGNERHDVLEVRRVLGRNLEDKVACHVPANGAADIRLHLVEILVGERQAQSKAAGLGEDFVEGRRLEVLEFVGKKVEVGAEVPVDGLLNPRNEERADEVRRFLPGAREIHQEHLFVLDDVFDRQFRLYRAEHRIQRFNQNVLGHAVEDRGCCILGEELLVRFPIRNEFVVRDAGKNLLAVCFVGKEIIDVEEGAAFRVQKGMDDEAKYARPPVAVFLRDELHEGLHEVRGERLPLGLRLPTHHVERYRGRRGEINDVVFALGRDMLQEHLDEIGFWAARFRIKDADAGAVPDVLFDDRIEQRGLPVARLSDRVDMAVPDVVRDFDIFAIGLLDVEVGADRGFDRVDGVVARFRRPAMGGGVIR